MTDYQRLDADDRLARFREQFAIPVGGKAVYLCGNSLGCSRVAPPTPSSKQCPIGASSASSVTTRENTPGCRITSCSRICPLSWSGRYRAKW